MHNVYLIMQDLYYLALFFDIVFMLADLLHLSILIRYSCSLMDNIRNFTTLKALKEGSRMCGQGRFCLIFIILEI